MPPVSWDDALATGSDRAIDTAKVHPSDLACFIYTAGTTGPSKGCMLSHNYIVSLADQIARAWDRKPDDVVLTPLPLFHFNAIAVCVVGSLLTGGSAAIELRLGGGIEVRAELGERREFTELRQLTLDLTGHLLDCFDLSGGPDPADREPN